MESPFIIVITACPNSEEADKLSKALIDGRLAACVQASMINSRYRWRGQIETQNEIRLLIKTKASKFEDIVKMVKSLLSYENPEVLAVPIINGSDIYLDWITQETNN